MTARGSRTAYALGGAALALALGRLAWPSSPAAPRPSMAAASHADDAIAPRGIVTAGVPARTDVVAPAALPGSLEGTEADGAVEADATGHLVISRELRRLFDYFLTASGEEPIAVMRARIIAALRARLPALAAGEAIDILDRYLAYREAARGMTPTSSELAALDQVHDLRARWLPPAVVRAFFADEEAAIYAALARRDVAADRTLSAAERDRRLAELDARVPAEVRAARAAAIAPVAELAQETALRAAGGTDQQIADLRTSQLGSAAAARLAELDRAHAAWDARLAQFRRERAALRADQTFDDAERARRISELLARSFTEPERRRVEALDRMASDSASH